MNRGFRTRLAWSACNAVLLLLTAPAAGQASDLLITEYTCLTQAPFSNSRFLEITNLTSTPIYIANFDGHPGANGPYFLTVNFSSATGNGTAITFQGGVQPGRIPAVDFDPKTGDELPLLPGEAYVIAQFNGGLQGNGIVTNFNINGNDAVLLRRGAANGPIVDSIGQVGNNPGVEWGTGRTSTYLSTLRRKTTVCQGDVNTSNGFNPSFEWIGIHYDDWSGYGRHTGCSNGEQNLPPVTADDFATVNEDSSVNISFYLNDNDVDSTILPERTIVDPPDHGVLTFPGDANTNVLLPALVYTPSPNFNGTDSFVYQVTDEFGAVSNPATVTVNVVPFNDAPILDNSSPFALPTIYANDFTNPGIRVIDLVGTSITDPDSGAMEGIAIDFADNSGGAWQYSLGDVNSNGSVDAADFQPLVSLTISYSRLVAADADNRVRFVPAAGFGGDVSFTFVAWDRTAGSDGQAAGTQSRGGTSCFGIAVGTAVQSVVYRTGDVNGSGAADATDVIDFVNVLLGLNVNPGHVARSDINQSGAANGDDIAPFVDAFL